MEVVIVGERISTSNDQLDDLPVAIPIESNQEQETVRYAHWEPIQYHPHNNIVFNNNHRRLYIQSDNEFGIRRCTIIACKMFFILFLFIGGISIIFRVLDEED